jgi:hypothetical protein
MSLNFMRLSALRACSACSSFFVGAQPFVHTLTTSIMNGATEARCCNFGVDRQEVCSYDRERISSKSRDPIALNPESKHASSAAIEVFGSASVRVFAILQQKSKNEDNLK